MSVGTTARRHWPLLAVAAVLAAAPCAAEEGSQESRYAGAPAHRQTDTAPSDASPAAAMEETLRMFVDRQTAGFPGRVEVTVGALDGRAALAQCSAPEPFIPAGTRLWGRSYLGMRCRDGARWSVLVPVQVRIFAPALRSARPLGAGQALESEDYEILETELTREAPGILTSVAEVSNLVLQRALPAGTPLRREHFRPRSVAGAGDQVTLVYAGPGFSVSGSGKLMQAAAEGQLVRVQVESGRILSGIARPGRTVEVRF